MLPTNSDAFLIETYTDSTFMNLIDKDNSKTIVATSDSLSTVIITPSQSITGISSIYKFEITTKNTIPIGGTLLIDFPSEIILKDVTSRCFNFIGFEATASCVNTESSITVINAFLTQNFSPSLLSFEIDLIKNPVTTQSTNTFKIYSKFSSLIIDQTLAGVIVAMTTPMTFIDIKIEISSEVVGNINDYLFKITPYNPIYDQSVIIVTPPSDVYVGVDFRCETSDVKIAVSCIQYNDAISLTLELNESTDLNAEFSFTIVNVRNPLSTKPSSSFQVTSSINGYLIDSTRTGLIVQADVPASIVSASIVLLDYGISQTTTYRFKITTIHEIPIGGYIEISIPSDIVITDNCQILGFDCELLDNNVIKALTFVEKLYPGEIAIEISGIQNNNNAKTSGNFIITSKTADQYSIDINSSLQVEFTCYSPCETCVLQPNTCLSCIKTSTNPYFYDGTCNSECNLGYLDIGNSKKCSACDESCQSCSGVTSFCTSCLKNGNFPYLQSNQCLSRCSSGYYSDISLICQSCDPTCFTCENSATNCLTCLSPLISYRNQCIASCDPATQIILNDICYDCDENCLSCQDSLSFCTSCDPGLFLYKNSCVTECPDSISIEKGDECVDCDEPCNTCDISTTNCTSCMSDYNLYDNSCIDICPSSHADINGICQKCSSECFSCENSIRFCTGCFDGKFLYNGDCVSNCPEGLTIAYEDTCIDCNLSCKTCEVLTDRCTSCKNDMYLFDDVCVDQCPDNMRAVNGQCTICKDNCQLCDDGFVDCVDCKSGLFLYKGTCYDDCPVNSTVALEDQCQECKYPCVSCIGKIDFCLSCDADLFLHENNCLDKCPDGFYEYINRCIKNGLDPGECSAGCDSFMMANDICDDACNVQACNYDNLICLKIIDNSTVVYLDTFAIKEVPLPSSVLGTLGLSIAIIAKIAASSTYFFTSILSVLSIIETAS